MKHRIVSISFLLIICAFFILSRLITPPVVSLSERRTLATFPTFSWQSVSSGEFMGSYETYAADSFPFRESFRTLRAYVILDGFRMLDKDALYRGDSGIGRFARINETEYRNMARKIQTIVQQLPSMHTYFAIVPDKSIYAGRFLPGFDMTQASQIMKEALPNITHIDLSEVLSADSYYRTDIHWDQSKISPIASKITESMNAALVLRLDVQNQGEFYGVYAGQLALPVQMDTMLYQTPTHVDSVENSVKVHILADDGTIQAREMYDQEGFSSIDPYNFFLYGPTSLIWITNEQAADKTLYLFRDSFGSSLAPLLAYGGAYSEIVLIDLRYIDSRVLSQYVDFKEGSDLLFMYSSQILNNSSVIKVK